MQGGSKGIDLEEYQTNSEWDMIDSTATVEEESDEAAVIYTLKIKRKPRYMVLSIILPVLMLSVLNLFVFVLPCDSGEKASYAVTVFLAFAVFLTIISAALPTNSESLSIFSVYIIILTVQSTLITMIALTVLRIRQFETPVPKIIIKLVAVLYCQCCEKEHSKIEPLENNGKLEDDMPIKEIASLKAKNGGFSSKTEIYTMTMKEAIDGTTEQKGVEECDWKKVANALDRLLFCFFAFVTVTSSLVCLLYALYAPKV